MMCGSIHAKPNASLHTALLLCRPRSKLTEQATTAYNSVIGHITPIFTELRRYFDLRTTIFSILLCHGVVVTVIAVQYNVLSAFTCN